MKVILLKDIEGIGKMGEMKEVKQGYFRNFLLPKELALEANDRNMKIYERKKQEQLKREQKLVEETKKFAEELEKVSCTINVKVGEDDKMFGSVTNVDVAQCLKDNGFEIDKRDIKLDEPIKELGVYTLDVNLHHGVTGKIKLWIVKE